jgi:hypothetical protein
MYGTAGRYCSLSKTRCILCMDGIGGRLNWDGIPGWVHDANKFAITTKFSISAGYEMGLNLEWRKGERLKRALTMKLMK